jgi:hypothetical protein
MHQQKIKKLVLDKENGENNAVIKNKSSNDLNNNINLLGSKTKEQGKEEKNIPRRFNRRWKDGSRTR